jgi:hypothetical protein
MQSDLGWGGEGGGSYILRGDGKELMHSVWEGDGEKEGQDI